MDRKCKFCELTKNLRFYDIPNHNNACVFLDSVRASLNRFARRYNNDLDDFTIKASVDAALACFTSGLIPSFSLLGILDDTLQAQIQFIKSIN